VDTDEVEKRLKLLHKYNQHDRFTFDVEQVVLAACRFEEAYVHGMDASGGGTLQFLMDMVAVLKRRI
jgi:hypothetical protein